MTYYDDGRTNTAFYASSSPFDRKYEFDFAARLKEAYSGDEAHGGSAPQLSQANSPYRQTYTYDEWNNVTGRAGRIWTQYDNYGAVYGSDNRSTGFQYDAAGNAYATGDGNYNIDAAGRPDAFVSLQQWQAYSGWDNNHPNAPALETTDTFDGAGQVVKHINHTRHDDSTESFGNITYAMSDTTTTTYYVHSTVLGGKTIEELDQNGAKTKGYVYSGSARIATQLISGSTNSVEFASTNPVTGAVTKTDAGGTYSAVEEPDPLSRDLTAPPDPMVVNDPVASTKFDRVMPIEASWGPSQEFLNNNQAWANEMDLMQLRNATSGPTPAKATIIQILEGNPNLGVRTNGGRTLTGAEAAYYLIDFSRAWNSAETDSEREVLGARPVVSADSSNPQNPGTQGRYPNPPKLPKRTASDLVNAFNAAYAEFRDRLLNNADCKAFFGGDKGVNRALAAFHNTSFGFRNVPHNEKTGNITLAWRIGRSIIFNSNEDAGFGLNTLDLALTFLHETAHRVNLIPHDNDTTQKGREQSEKNNDLIIDKCFGGRRP
jgi:hypothetical protein